MSLLALPTIGCHRPSTQLSIPTEVEQEEEAPRGEARERLEPLPVEAVGDLLPAQTVGLIELGDPVEFLGMLAALDQVPEFNAVRGEARSRLGVDLFDAQEWADVGIDSGGPAGIGLLDIEAQAGFAYLTLTDAGAFEDFVARFIDATGNRVEMSAAEVGGARVIRMGEELSVVLREGYAVAVLVDRPSRAQRDYVALVATIDPREALSRSEGFAWARQRLEAEDDGMLYIAPAQLLAQIERGLQGDIDNYGVRYAREELDAARARGARAEEIREWERRLEEERTWQAEREASQRASLELARRVVGPIGAGFIAGDLRETGVAAHGAALIPGASPLRDVFVPVSAESPLFSALDEPPLAVLEGRADMQRLLELVELVAQADGEDLSRLNAELRAEVGVDVLAELWPAFDGVGGIALTEHRAPKLDKLDTIPKSFGFAAHFGLNDPQVIESMLDRLVKDKRMRGMLHHAKRGPGWRFSVPEWHEVSMQIVDRQLVISSDAGLAGRIAGAKPGKQAATLGDPGHLLRGPYPTPALRMYQRARWLMLAEADEPWEQSAESMLYDMNSHPQLSPDEAAKVPRSKAFKKKFKELGKVVDELNRFERKQARERLERQLEFADRLGAFAMHVERREDGLGMSALWEAQAGTKLMDYFVGMSVFGYDDTTWRERERISQRSYALLDELRLIRQADLDAAAAKRP